MGGHGRILSPQGGSDLGFGIRVWLQFWEDTVGGAGGAGQGEPWAAGAARPGRGCGRKRRAGLLSRPGTRVCWCTDAGGDPHTPRRGPWQEGAPDPEPLGSRFLRPRCWGRHCPDVPEVAGEQGLWQQVAATASGVGIKGEASSLYKKYIRATPHAGPCPRASHMVTAMVTAAAGTRCCRAPSALRPRHLLGTALGPQALLAQGHALLGHPPLLTGQRGDTKSGPSASQGNAEELSSPRSSRGTGTRDGPASPWAGSSLLTSAQSLQGERSPQARPHP